MQGMQSCLTESLTTFLGSHFGIIIAIEYFTFGHLLKGNIVHLFSFSKVILACGIRKRTLHCNGYHICFIFVRNSVHILGEDWSSHKDFHGFSQLSQ